MSDTQQYEDIGQRRIKIDEDTIVGYTYKTSEFYIINKDTTTTRKTAQEIKQILDILTDNPSLITVETLVQLLVVNPETLSEITYTYSDTDSYLKTLQFNNHEQNPLTLDLSSHSLYIMNSDLIFDLSLNEAKPYRTSLIMQYYKNILGLTITQEQMNVIYDLLTASYSPTIQLQIKPRTSTSETLWYSNQFKLLNYNNKSDIEFTCTYNPYNKYEIPTTKLADISSINMNTNTIQLTDTIPTELQTEDYVTIQNAETIINEEPFTDDGTYQITGIDTEANIIQLNASFPVSYDTPRIELYKVQSKMQISSIDRETFKITLTNSIPDTYSVGNIITVIGTNTTIDGEGVSADGNYTIVRTEGNSLIVAEQLPISYSGASAYTYKKLPLGSISSIASNTISLEAEPQETLTNSNQVVVEGYDNTLYTVSGISGSTITLTTNVTEPPSPYTVPYAQLYEPNPQTWVNVEVTKGNSNVPTGSFMVDELGQCTQYLQTFYTQDAEKTKIGVDMTYVTSNVTKRVPDITDVAGLSNITWNCLGFYSEKYIDGKSN